MTTWILYKAKTGVAMVTETSAGLGRGWKYERIPKERSGRCCMRSIYCGGTGRS